MNKAFFALFLLLAFMPSKAQAPSSVGRFQVVTLQTTGNIDAFKVDTETGNTWFTCSVNGDLAWCAVPTTSDSVKARQIQ